MTAGFNFVSPCHFRLTQPSPKERALKMSAVKVLSFGEDLGEALFR
jgi:hypothetical protein